MIKLSAGYITKKDIPAIAALGVGIALTVFVFIIVRRLEFKTIQDEFILDTQNYSVALEKSIEGNLNSLHAIEGLYATSPRVTRARFHIFTRNLLLHNDGIHSLRWIPRVAGAERKKYEDAAIRDGRSTYRFLEFNSQKQLVAAGKRNEYFPIFFSESIGGQEIALGLDLSASPRAKSLLETARDKDDMVATHRITLLLENDPQFAFLVMQPIYRNGSPHDTVEERRKNLIGYAQGVFRFGDMVSAALKGIKLDGIELSLSDPSAAPEKRILYSNFRKEHFAGDDLSFTKTLSVADRSWALQFHGTSNYLSAHRTPYAWVILAAGLLSASLFTLYILHMKRHAFQIERSNNTITTVLNSIDEAIAILDSNSEEILACNKMYRRESGVQENEVLRKPCNDIARKGPLPCDKLCESCPVTLVKKTGEHASRESRYHAEDGADGFIEMSAFPVKDNKGGVAQVVYIGRDITERKKLENARLEDQKLQRLSAEQQAVVAQLRMLQAQIEPHFLFNTLANVISLIDREPKAAKETLQQLTRFLRISLQRSREDASTLGQETDMLRDYLNILKIRLGPRIDYAIEIPGELRELKFPPMLLQPIVENAIKHGIEPRVEGGRIAIKADASDGILRLTVSDTGLGLSDMEKSQGVGLRNVRARLRALYNTRGRLILEENIPCGATATIEVPL